MRNLAYVALFASAALYAQTATVATPPPLKDVAALSKSFDSYFSAYAASKDFSGVVLLAQGDKVLVQKTYGMADAARRVPNRIDTAFRIASLSKTFTGAGIAILMERGKVGLKDPLSKYVPDFPNGQNITIEQLLSHTSGVGQLDSPETSRNCLPLAEMARRIGAIKPMFAPGTNDAYSNEGYVLLAAVIEQVSGTSYDRFLRQNIFTPLHMEHTGIMCNRWPVAKHASGSISGLGNSVSPLPYEEAGWNGPGSIYSTAPDLLIWLRAIEANKLFAFDKLRYPYGWGRRNYSGRKLVEQSGELEGYNSQISLYFADKIYFVFLSNIESGMFNRLPKDLESIAFGIGEPSSPAKAPEIAEPRLHLADFGGDYTSPQFPAILHVNVKDGRLWMHWSESAFWRPLIRTGNDDFYMRAEYAAIRFKRDSAGKVITSDWIWGDQPPLVMTRK